MILSQPPVDFKPSFEAVGCFFEGAGKILLLLRQDHKPHGNTWGLPSGKIEAGETAKQAMLRELQQETGYEDAAGLLVYVGKVYVRHEGVDFIYYVYRLSLKSQPKVEINKAEHKEYDWFYPEEALKMNLIHDLDACIKKFM